MKKAASIKASHEPFLVVMAGGSGTRFWPKSTSKKPKQLLSFEDGEPTLISQTVARFSELIQPDRRMIVTTEALARAIETEIPAARILSEPQGRNTAPCVYWAARAVAEVDPEAVMLVMPADHLIRDVAAFKKTVSAAIAWAEGNGDLVTLGVKPSRPETGYGYLRVARGGSGNGSRKVEAFVEKPNLEKAKAFLKSGDYLWNGGMFVWRASVILKAFDDFMPELGKAWNASKGNVREAYPKMTATSIDFGVMERAKNVVCFPLDCGWDDLGSWISVEDIARKKHPAGVVVGGDVIAIDSTGNIVDAASKKVIALLGIENLIVVETADALLVARKDRAQDIRLVVEQVKKRRPELA